MAARSTRWGGKLGNGDAGPSGVGFAFDGQPSETLAPQRVLRQLRVREVCAAGSKGLAVASDGRVYGWGIADADATLLRGARRDRYPGPSPRDRVKTWQPRPTQYARAPESAQAARRGLKMRSHADVLK